MKSEPKPFRYPFETPSIAVGLAAINATESSFRIEPCHLEAWFKKGTIARYLLLDDIRELWNREGFGEPLEKVSGKVKNCKLIASCQLIWSGVEQKQARRQLIVFFALIPAEALYQ
ncbi:hypothetical protein [Pantoea septica]|uniref:Uncharacterized protein n=1 Tax=Pantoea septica TaxID=472695 RepID=A0ABX3UUS1_9GAMM|nr:hypothetical protein [Pantoea septica]ORN01679.1 hypothetical protein HA46_05665 [Pantoea septica]